MQNIVRFLIVAGISVLFAYPVLVMRNLGSDKTSSVTSLRCNGVSIGDTELKVESIFGKPLTSSIDRDHLVVTTYSGSYTAAYLKNICVFYEADSLSVKVGGKWANLDISDSLADVQETLGKPTAVESSLRQSSLVYNFPHLDLRLSVNYSTVRASRFLSLSFGGEKKIRNFNVSQPSRGIEFSSVP